MKLSESFWKTNEISLEAQFVRIKQKISRLKVLKIFEKSSVSFL